MLRLFFLWTACLLLFPILALQGLWVRRQAIQLPEAIGARASSVSERLLVVLGDSVVAGVGVDERHQALPAKLAGEMSLMDGSTWAWRAMGTNGDRLKDILQHVPRLSLLEQKPDMVVVNVGVNDVTKLTSLMRWQLEITTLVSQLKQGLDVPVVFLGLPPMQHFSLLPQPLRFALGVRAQILDQSLERVANLLPNIHFVKTELSLQEGFMASDGYHPSAEGVEVWSQSLAAQLRDRALI